MPVPKPLRQQLIHCQIADQYRLGRQLDRLEKKPRNAATRQAYETLTRQIADSRAACQRRDAAIPVAIDYPAQLPVSAKAAEIAAMLHRHQVLIVAGDTGSGKTTQLPKICLEAGFGRRGIIGHTQPRRLAAISVSDRIAEELACPKGVAYQVRFDDRSAPETFIKLMTDGILLAEIQRDRFLNRYEVLIVDEAHERSLNIDFLLGFLKQLLSKRPELKLIVTSATIDVDKFSSHFDAAPVIAVSGRTYPVETRYQPLNRREASDGGEAQIDGIVEAVEGLRAESTGGDVLVFLSSEREIRETAQALRKRRWGDTEILPLYARLRHGEQVKIFAPHRGRRIVLATNVAETSITVPGIKYVIDSGLARISRYSLQSKVQRLPIEPISQASAKQRQGRCGRLQDGVCIRLYSEADFSARPPYTDPEIQRTNLASVILRMRFLKLGDVEAFPFLEPPSGKAINEGFKLLFELNALNSKRDLTQAGRHMASLPVDPRHGRMLVTANDQGCLRELLIVVSALSIQDPRELGSDTRQQALQKLAFLNHDDSDFMSLLNLWHEYEQRRQDLTQSQLRKYCRQHFLSFMRMREWREVHRQLLLACQQLGYRQNRKAGNYQAIHKSIVSGSLNQIACRFDGKVYQGNRNRKLSLLGSSVLSSSQPKWIVTGEQIETSQTFASMAARIEPAWVEEMAMHLVKREFFDPHWSVKRQEAMVYEKVQLYGLVIVEKSVLRYAPIDQAAARSLFIDDGLVAGSIKSQAQFLRHNQDFLKRLAKQEEKLRRPDLLFSERDITNFYEQRIPDAVASTRQLESWLCEQAGAGESLQMDEESLQAGSQADYQAMFPDQAAIQSNRLAIDYQFDPGSQRDGATIDVPLQVLPQLGQGDIDWAVPGLIREKCSAWLKGLPKSQRKQFIPIAAFVESALAQMSAGDGDLLGSFIAQIRILKRLDIPRDDFERVELAPHLRIKLRVLDEQGAELFLGESLSQAREELKARLSGPEQTASSTTKRHELEREGLTSWEFEELPRELAIGEQGRLVLTRYPCLIDEGESVGIRLLADANEADAKHQKGLLRLYMLHSVQQQNLIKKQFQRFAASQALLLPLDPKRFVVDCVRACYQAVFLGDATAPREREHFEASLRRGRAELIGMAERLESILGKVFKARHAVLIRLTELERYQDLDYLLTDIRGQLDHLLTEGFVVDTEFRWLKEFPRYLQAIDLRLAKAPHVGAKDRSHTEQLQSNWRRWSERAGKGNLGQQTDLALIRWMIEELRVSLFAQSLGTAVPVSAARIERRFDNLDSLGN